MGEWHVMLKDRILHRFGIEEGERLNIGRGEDVDVNLDNAAVSRRHASLEMRNGTYYLTDLESTNGTFVNGRKIRATIPVTNADRIEIGKFRFAPVQVLRARSSTTMPGDFEGTVYVAPNGKQNRVGARRTPRLTLIQGKASPNGLSFEGKETVTLGKHADCDLHLNGWLVGKTECSIVARDDDYYLVDHPGWRCTRINGQKIRGEQRLHTGDMISIAGSKLRFE
jgi:pSer/pThr/pTyr-binding forkhead associated (FHA) protein